MNEQGFIKLSRKYFEHLFWNEPRTFSKAEAWLDLIGSARFEATVELVNGYTLTIRRGELPASRRFLEQRWKWGSTKVANFLQTLNQQGMINQRKDQGQTILMLCKYETYNSLQTTGKPAPKPDKEVREKKLDYPYASEKFTAAWEQLLASPKWKRKSDRTLQLSLNQLSRFEEDFAILLIELAAANNWQGVVYTDTEARYRQWQGGSGNNCTKLNFTRHDNTKRYEKF